MRTCSVIAPCFAAPSVLLLTARYLIPRILRRNARQCYSALAPNHSCSDSWTLLSEDAAGQHVDNTENEGEDTSTDNNAPVGEAHLMRGSGGLVEVAKCGDAKSEHQEPEGMEGMRGTEKRVVVQEVGSEERGLREDQKERQQYWEGMGDGFEEEELDFG